MEYPYTEPDRSFILDVRDAHLDEEDGTPYWLEVVEEDYDDIETARDDIQDWRTMVDVLGLNSRDKTERFEDALRHRNYTDFVPQNRVDQIMDVGETGGTSGMPKQVPLTEPEWEENIDQFNEYLDNAGIPRDEDMLWIGPAFPPHTIGKYAADLADSRGGNILGVIVDTKHIKNLAREGKEEELNSYMETLGKRTKEKVTGEDPGYAFTTSKILTQMAESGMDVDKLGLEGVIHAGAPLSPGEQYRSLNEIYEGPFTGGFGTAMTEFTGVQVPDLDDYDVKYLSAGPTRMLEVYEDGEEIDVDEQRETVDIGEEGVLSTSLISENLLIPAFLEEDRATLVETPSEVGNGLPTVKNIHPSETRQEQEGEDEEGEVGSVY